MHYDGWLADFRIYRETTVLGERVGIAWRPPGIRELAFSPTVKSRFQRKNVHGSMVGGDTIHQHWELNMSRQSAVDTLLLWWLQAMQSRITGTVEDSPAPGYTTTTRLTNTSDALPSFTIEIVLPDGTGRRFRGCVPNRIEFFIQSGRSINEDVSFYALRNEPMIAADITPSELTEPHELSTGRQATHALTLAAGAWTPSADIIPTFSSQIIFTRDCDPCQFDTNGIPSRYDSTGAWDIAGKSTLRATSGQYNALTTAQPCQLWWGFYNPHHPSRAVEFHIPGAIAKLSGTTAISKDLIDHNLDWMATDRGTGLLRTSIVTGTGTVDGAALREDGGIELREDGGAALRE